HQAIDADKARLDAARPLPQHTVASLRDKLVLEWTYHSNAIEGNTLTLRETKVVLEGITVGGKSLREHFEAINHRDAILFVEQVV
ncbi:Fic family protein, partial [Acinetobacter baumannii]